MVCINSARINPNNIYTKRDMWCHDVSLVISPANATDYEVEWHVMDPEIASINPSGYVLGLSPGTTRIYAMITDCSGRRIKSSIAEVTVDDYTDVTIDDMYTASRVMGVGDTITLEAVVTPERAATKGVIWCSTDPEVLSISQNGNELTVTALKLGNAVVVATPVDDMDISSCCAIQVMPTIPAEDIDVIPKLILVPNEEKKLRAEVIPSNATNKSLYWTSSNKAVAIVNKNTGLVQAVSAGQATITVGIYNTNIKNTCNVTVDDREIVIVEEDDEGGHDFFKVTFPPEPEDPDSDDGGNLVQKIWKSVGVHLDVNSNPYEFKHHLERAESNITQDFSDSQLAFLYHLDPFGVEYCVSRKTPREKDTIYWEIFGNEEEEHGNFYFTTTENGVAYHMYTENGRENYYSKAEVVFGAHLIPNWSNFYESILTKFFTSIPVVSDIIDGVSKSIKIAQALFLSKSIVEAASEIASSFLSDYVEGQADEALDDLLGWPYKLLKEIYEFGNILQESFVPENIHDVAIYGKMCGLKYRIQFSGTSRQVFMEEIFALCSE